MHWIFRRDSGMTASMDSPTLNLWAGRVWAVQSDRMKNRTDGRCWPNNWRCCTARRVACCTWPPSLRPAATAASCHLQASPRAPQGAQGRARRCHAQAGRTRPHPAPRRPPPAARPAPPEASLKNGKSTVSLDLRIYPDRAVMLSFGGRRRIHAMAHQMHGEYDGLRHRTVRQA